jgi:hypothetical protein
MANCKKTKKEKTNLWDEPVVIDGETISEQELAEFLDWSLVNKNNDFEYFRYLKTTGKFHRPTSKELSEFVTNNISKKPKK